MLQFVPIKVGMRCMFYQVEKNLDVSNDDMSEITPGEFKKSDLKKAFGKMSSGRKNSRPY